MRGLGRGQGRRRNEKSTMMSLEREKSAHFGRLVGSSFFMSSSSLLIFLTQQKKMVNSWRIQGRPNGCFQFSEFFAQADRPSPRHERLAVRGEHFSLVILHFHGDANFKSGPRRGRKRESRWKQVLLGSALQSRGDALYARH